MSALVPLAVALLTSQPDAINRERSSGVPKSKVSAQEGTAAALKDESVSGAGRCGEFGSARISAEAAQLVPAAEMN